MFGALVWACSSAEKSVAYEISKVESTSGILDYQTLMLKLRRLAPEKSTHL